MDADPLMTHTTRNELMLLVPQGSSVSTEGSLLGRERVLRSRAVDSLKDLYTLTLECWWSNDEQTGMYGPPLCCKRKMRVTGWSAQMYTALLERKLRALMECAALSSYLVRQP